MQNKSTTYTEFIYYEGQSGDKLSPYIMDAASKDLMCKREEGFSKLMALINQIEKINLSDLKILVADDVVINQVVLSKTLSKLGYNCELAANGIEVLERHETLDFDLIFMDCQMPLMDGLKATEEIRDVEKNKNSLKPSTFIVAVTGNATDEDRRLCQLAGMNYFLPKPFMTADIEKVIQMAYDHKKSFESAQKAA